MERLITAAFEQCVVCASKGRIVYLPEGKHEIEASINGKPGKATVIVDSSILASFQESLEQRKSQKVRPFCGFDHKPGPASFRPESFEWEDGVGLVLAGKWTKAGKTAVDEDEYDGFSPTFRIDSNGKPIGIRASGEIGSLTNNPAFEQLPAVAAEKTTPQTTMLDITPLIKLGLVKEDQDPETAIEAAKASIDAIKSEAANPLQTEIEAAKAEIVSITAERDALKQANEQLVQAANAAAEAEVDKIIADAVEAKRIPAQDDKAKEFWKTTIMANREAAAILNGLPAAKFQAESSIDRKNKDALAGLSGLERAIAAQKLASEPQ